MFLQIIQFNQEMGNTSLAYNMQYYTANSKYISEQSNVDPFLRATQTCRYKFPCE